MLVEFTIENFRSILEKKTFSLQTAPYLKKFRESNTFNTQPINLLKNAVVFGANGSGKTNLIEAIETFETMIVNSYRINAAKSVRLPYQPFSMTEDTPDYTFFEIILLIKEKLYKYSIKYNEKMIIYESMDILKEKGNEVIYSRTYNELQGNYDYILNDTPDLTDKTKKTVLYLTVLNEFSNDLEGVQGKEVYDWFLDSLLIVDADYSSINSRIVNRLEDPTIKERVLNFLKIADFNIVDIETRTRKTEIPAYIRSIMEKENMTEIDDFIEFTDVYTVYNKYDMNDNVIDKSSLHAESFESRGTNKMITISLILLDAMEKGKTVFIDEFDNAFHYEISLFLLKIFNSSLYNEKSQFILNTHDISLLDATVLRVDQIWFVEKSKYNQSDFYSLYDFNGTSNKARSDVKFAKDYIKGKFGAIPIINDSLFQVNIFKESDDYGSTK